MYRNHRQISLKGTSLFHWPTERHRNCTKWYPCIRFNEHIQQKQHLVFQNLTEAWLTFMTLKFCLRSSVRPVRWHSEGMRQMSSVLGCTVCCNQPNKPTGMKHVSILLTELQTQAVLLWTMCFFFNQSNTMFLTNCFNSEQGRDIAKTEMSEKE